MKKRDLCCIFIYIAYFLIVLSDILISYLNTIFSYSDDLINLILFLILCVLLVHPKLNRKYKIDIKLIFLLFFVYLLGVLGNLVSQYQTNYKAIFLDALSWFKFFGTFPLFMALLNGSKNPDYYFKIVKRCVKITFYLAFVFEIFSLLGVFKTSIAYSRLGINALTFGRHPSAACSIMCLCSSFFLLENGKKKYFYTFISLIFACLTLRSKAVLFLVATLYFMFFYKRKYFKIQIVFISLLGFALVYNQFAFYFLNSNASRAVALKTSFMIANNFVFTGSGFASFGTIYSGMYYSKAYYIYELSNRWGFSPTAYSFVGDGGFATIIGQFGYLGSIIILIYLFKLFFRIGRIKAFNSRICCYCLFAYLLISSTNEIAFTNSIAIVYSFLFALLFVIDARRKKDD